MTTNTECILRAILGVAARQAFPPDHLLEILSRNGGPKQVRAFNMCDGTRGQGEIARELKLDSGNFSRTVGRWINAGILVRLGEGREAKLLHVYPLADTVA